MPETIEFPCPRCHTVLRVPTPMAGITGPCPHCRASITSPSSPPAPKSSPRESLQPKPASPTGPSAISSQSLRRTPAQGQPGPPSNSYNEDPNGTERRLLPSVIFLVLFLSLTAAAIYLILDNMGMIQPKDKEPATPPSGQESIESGVQAPENTPFPISEKPTPPSPAIVIPPSPAPPEPQDAEPAEAPEIPKPAELPPAELPPAGNILESAITPEDPNQSGEVPTELPEPSSPPQ